MTDSNEDITPAILLGHMHEMKKDLKQEMGNMEKRLVQRMDDGFGETNKRLEHLEQDVFILVSHKQAHEERLDTMEKVQLPKTRKSIRSLSKKLADHISSPLHQSVLQS